MSKVVAILFTGLALLASASHAQPTTSSDLVASELRMAAGSDALDCGLVRLGESADNALSCAKNAAGAGRPFWVAIEQLGVDSDVWEGALLTHQGFYQVFHYDSNPYGRADLWPKIVRETCGTLVFGYDSREPFSCRYRDRP